jgi:hypothetical protein
VVLVPGSAVVFVAAALSFPNCFGAASSFYFLCSLCQQGSSLSSAASWRCWWWRPREWLGRWSALLPFLLYVFLFSSVLLCFRFLLLLFAGLLLTEMAMAAGGGGEEVLCSWWCCCGWEEDGELSSVSGSALLLFSSPA